MAIRIQRSHSFLPLSLSVPFSSSQPEPEPGSETRIATALSILLHHRSKTRWTRLRSASPNGFTPPESAQILLRLRNNPSLALRFFRWSRTGGPHHHLPHCAIAHVLARNRLRPETRSLLRSAVLSGPDDPLALFKTLSRTYTQFGSAPFVFDFLVQAYLESDNLDLAVRILRILKNNNIQPSISTCNSLIRSASKLNGSDAGFKLYADLFNANAKPAPNISTFNSLLLAFYRDRRLEMAGVVRNEMERFGCRPNVFTYSILMAGLSDEGLVDDAAGIWREMDENGVEKDVMAYNTMIKGLCEAGEVGRAEELFREMGLGGVEASCTTFECLVGGYCRAGQVDSAVALWRDAKRRGFGMEAAVVDGIVEGLCEKGRVAEGSEVLREEMRREGFGPSRRSYEALLKGFCRGGEMEEAVRVQAEMAGRGFGAGKGVYREFVEGYRRVGDVEKAARLEEEMIEMGFGRDCQIS